MIYEEALLLFTVYPIFLDVFLTTPNGIKITILGN